MRGSIGHRETEGGTGSVFWFTIPLGRRGKNGESLADQNRVESVT